MLRLQSVIMCVGIVCLASLVFAQGQDKAQQRVEVITNDGNIVQGVLLKQSKKEIVLTVRGVKMTLPESEVHNVRKLPSFAQIYAQRNAKLKKSDWRGRYQLAYFLYSHGASDLSLKELKFLSKQFPDNAKVKALEQIVVYEISHPDKSTNQMAGKSSKNQQRPHTQPSTQPTTTSPSSPATKPAEKLPVSLNKRLTQEQINRIKVYEVDLTKKPLVRIPHGAIVTFFRKYVDASKHPSTRQSRMDFRRLPGYEQLSKFFSYKARDLYGKVAIMGEPAALRTFHRRIQTSYVTNYCGTTKCHGGFTAPGGLYLFAAQPGSARTAYTDFYILNKYKNKDGKMINRQQPEKSLLVQYGMPRKIAKTPHPQVAGWHPRIRSRRSRYYNLLMEFIAELYKPAPDYGINYDIPMPKVKKKK